MSRVLFALLLLAGVAHAQAPQQQVLELAVGGGTVTIAGSFTTEGCTAVAADLSEDALPEGALWFLVLGAPLSGGQVDPMVENGPPVLYRGLLCGESALVEAEGARSDDLAARGLAMPRTIVQLRFPTVPEPQAVAVYRKGTPGSPSTRVALLPIVNGGAGLSAGEELFASDRYVNRVHLQCFPEGFTAQDLRDSGAFAVLARSLVARLLEIEPFKRYRQLMSVSGVLAPSREAGISLEEHPPRSSAYGVQAMHMRDGDRILSGPDGTPLYPWRTLQIPSDGYERLLRTNTNNFPVVRVLLVQHSYPTGLTLAPGTPSPTVVLAPGDAELRLPHLIGHAFGLDDECAVTPPLCDRPFTPCANVARAGEPVPWQWLIDAGLLPAPVAGGHLCTDRYVHPSDACFMRRGSSTTFCLACQERLIEAFYERARLIDGTSPGPRQLKLDTPPGGFHVDLNANLTVTPIACEWWQDEALTNSSAGSVPTAPFGSSRPGHHVVRFLATDVTPLPGTNKALPLIRSCPHEARWDVYLRGTGLTALEPSGERLTTEVE